MTTMYLDGEKYELYRGARLMVLCTPKIVAETLKRLRAEPK